jgi:hypothetical protein
VGLTINGSAVSVDVPVIGALIQVQIWNGPGVAGTIVPSTPATPATDSQGNCTFDFSVAVATDNAFSLDGGSALSLPSGLPDNCDLTLSESRLDRGNDPARVYTYQFDDRSDSGGSTFVECEHNATLAAPAPENSGDLPATPPAAQQLALAFAAFSIALYRDDQLGRRRPGRAVPDRAGGRRRFRRLRPENGRLCRFDLGGRSSATDNTLKIIFAKCLTTRCRVCYTAV